MQSKKNILFFCLGRLNRWPCFWSTQPSKTKTGLFVHVQVHVFVFLLIIPCLLILLINCQKGHPCLQLLWIAVLWCHWLTDWKGHLLCWTAKISKIFFRHTYSWSNVGVGDQKPRYFCGDGTSYKKKEKRAIRYGHQPLYVFHLFSVKLLRSARWRNRKTRFSELVFGILMTTFHAALLFQKTISDTAFDMYA